MYTDLGSVCPPRVAETLSIVEELKVENLSAFPQAQDLKNNDF